MVVWRDLLDGVADLRLKLSLSFKSLLRLLIGSNLPSSFSQLSLLSALRYLHILHNHDLPLSSNFHLAHFALPDFLVDNG